MRTPTHSSLRNPAKDEPGVLFPWAMRARVSERANSAPYVRRAVANENCQKRPNCVKNTIAGRVKPAVSEGSGDASEERY